MPDWSQAAIELLRPFVDAWAARDKRQAAKKAGQLMFWSDGMLGALRKIADGRQKEGNLRRIEEEIRELAGTSEQDTD